MRHNPPCFYDYIRNAAETELCIYFPAVRIWNCSHILLDLVLIPHYSVDLEEKSRWLNKVETPNTKEEERKESPLGSPSPSDFLTEALIWSLRTWRNTNLTHIWIWGAGSDQILSDLRRIHLWVDHMQNLLVIISHFTTQPVNENLNLNFRKRLNISLKVKCQPYIDESDESWEQELCVDNMFDFLESKRTKHVLEWLLFYGLN